MTDKFRCAIKHLVPAPQEESKFSIFQVVRHIGLLEGLITLLILASFIQYGMGWANYLEQKFLAPKPKEKKVKKVKKSEVKEETKEAVDEFEHLKPSVYDTLPFQLYELCKQSPELIEYAKVREETFPKFAEDSLLQHISCRATGRRGS